MFAKAVINFILYNTARKQNKVIEKRLKSKKYFYYFVGKFIFPTCHVKRKLDIPSQTYKIICNMIMIPHAWINISRYLKAHIAW